MCARHSNKEQSQKKRVKKKEKRTRLNWTCIRWIQIPSDCLFPPFSACLYIKMAKLSMVVWYAKGLRSSRSIILMAICFQLIDGIVCSHCMWMWSVINIDVICESSSPAIRYNTLYVCINFLVCIWWVCCTMQCAPYKSYLCEVKKKKKHFQWKRDKYHKIYSEI